MDVDDTTCKVCSAEFLDPDDLLLHTAQVHKKEPSQSRVCKFCPSVLSSIEEYALHIRDYHLCSIKCCQFCTRAFTDEDEWRKHERRHVTPSKNTYSCSQCSTYFNNIVELECHEIKKHSNVKDGVLLYDCLGILSSVLSIKASTFLHSLGAGMTYLCIKCETMTPSVDEYINHLKERNCRAVVCETCCNVYKDVRGLKKHMKCSPECLNVSQGIRGKVCSKCMKCIDKMAYKAHVKNCKPIKCTHCNTLFMSIIELTDHQTKRHPLAVTVKMCQFCHREFVGSVALRKHVERVHKDLHLYKYKCVYCDSMFYKHPKDLFSHFFSKHQKLQPFSCKICNTPFRVRKKFTIHIKLEHKSVGFVEFDENYNVYFTDKKSENPFQPESLFPGEKSVEENKSSEISLEKLEKPTDLESQAENTEAPEATKQTKGIPKKLALKRGKSQTKADVSETDGNQTELEARKNITELLRKRKAVPKNKPSKRLKKEPQTENEVTDKPDQDSESDSDDQPLLQLKKKEYHKRLTKMRLSTWNIKKRSLNNKGFTCKICKKYCYTYQNYHNHMSLHSSNEVKKCIKCDKSYKSKEKLTRHMEKEHSTSKLTETLKNLIEKRKKGIVDTASDLSMSEKFKRTIKKVVDTPAMEPAKLTEVNEKLSVQKFIESFVPEGNEVKKTLQIEACVSIKPSTDPVKTPAIKMVKFTPKPPPKNIKLAMPIRFQKTNHENHNVTIKLVNPLEQQEQYYNDSFVDQVEYEEVIEPEREIIPEVAQEVMLESETKPKALPHKILLPKLPKNSEKIHIAHLMPEAPYYKIVKVDDVLKPKKPEIKPETKVEADIMLPGGTKLVTVNPLAHLLGDRPLEDVVGQYKNKYYKPKTCNFENAIAKALMQLKTPKQKKTRAQKVVKEKEKSVEI